jgi:Ni/Co efflux regulator RcnB
MRPRVPVVSSVPRPGTQPPLRVENHRGDNVRWNTDWRRDNRYDWRHWRDRHRSHFHLGIYYDPFGWGYQPYSIGWRLWPNYYSSSFWINDPWQYRLPYAPPGTRWVRYYDDALLVDVYTGEVVDVIYSFFW